MTTNSDPSRHGLVPLADRVRWSALLRLGLLVTAAGVWATIAEPVVTTPVVVVATGQIALVVVSLFAPRLGRHPTIFVLNASLVLDGVLLAVVVHLTGELGGPVTVLYVLHVSAVSLLMSFRTGAKVALWHSVLVLVTLHASATGVLTGGPLDGAPFATSTYLAFVLLVWVAALGTSAFAALNERELRRRRYDAEVLQRFAVRLSTVEDPERVARDLARTAVDDLGVRRALVMVLPAPPGAADRTGSVPRVEAVHPEAARRETRHPELVQREILHPETVQPQIDHPEAAQRHIVHPEVTVPSQARVAGDPHDARNPRDRRANEVGHDARHPRDPGDRRVHEVGHHVAAPATATDPTGSLLHRATHAAEPALALALDPADDAWLAARLPDAHGVVALPLPLADAGRGWLVLELGRRRLRGVERRLLSTAAQAAAHAALALTRASAVASLRQVARTDGLTGLANRRAFDLALGAALTTARETGRPFCVALVDLDHFKQVNDAHGHAVGDDVLRGAARALRAASRESDVVARYGGEEFTVIMPGDLRSAHAVAERLRHAVATADGPTRVTCSIGIGAWTGPDCTTEQILAAADAALYRAKADGRNRTVVGSSLDIAHEVS